MKRFPHLPELGSVIRAYEVRPVKPYTVDGMVVVAEAKFLSIDDGVCGKIPIGEVSPYDDFDPAALPQSPGLLAKMCWALLMGSDFRFLVVAQAADGSAVYLSHRRLRMRETSVANLADDPSYEAQGFRSLPNVLHHTLKHPLGLGGDDADWPALLAFDYDGPATIKRLRSAGCPAALQCDGTAKRLAESKCGQCSIQQKVKCVSILNEVRNAYEQQALACVAEASNPARPRHYHYTVGRRDTVVVFMDDDCGKVVAKGGRDGKVWVATFFQPDDCYPAAVNNEMKYYGEQAAIRGLGRGATVCNRASWGLEP